MSEEKSHEKAPWVPHTARELLAVVLPKHDLHTITWRLSNRDDSISFLCSCTRTFGATAAVLKKKGLTVAQAQHAMRNVPLRTPLEGRA